MLPRFGVVLPVQSQGGASVLLDILGVSRSVGVSNSLGDISMLQVDFCGGWGASCVSFASVGGLVGSGARISCDCRLLPEFPVPWHLDMTQCNADKASQSPNSILSKSMFKFLRTKP